MMRRLTHKRLSLQQESRVIYRKCVLSASPAACALKPSVSLACDTRARKAAEALDMRETSLKLSAIFLAAAVAGCVQQPVASKTTYTYMNQKYTDPASALAAHQRDMAEQIAAVPVASEPVGGRALIVVPDRDRLRPMMRGVFKSGVPSAEQLGWAIDFERQTLQGISDAVVKSHIFGSVTVLERNDTAQPTIDSYDYLLFFQVTQVGTTNLWTGRWVLQKRGSALQLMPHGDPGVAPVKVMASVIESVKQSTLKLARGEGLPATVNAAGAGATARRATGTGIIIAKDGGIITNAHVVQGCTTIHVMDHGETMTASVKAQDRPNDLVLLKVAHHWPVAVPFRDGTGIRQGDGVVALGYPLNGVLSADVILTTGSVSALAGLGNDTRVLQITAPVQPGNSGGPLLDMGGHLVGVVSAKLNAVAVAGLTGDIPQNVNFAIKSTIVRNFLDANAVGYATAPTRQALSAADVGDSAKKFTVLVECLR
jgi:S1-C subfamily serine protease